MTEKSHAVSNLLDITLDELDVLAYHYFTNRLTYEYDRFVYPDARRRGPSQHTGGH